MSVKKLWCQHPWTVGYDFIDISTMSQGLITFIICHDSKTFQFVRLAITGS